LSSAAVLSDSKHGYTWGDSDIILSYYIYASCFSAIIVGKLLL